MFCCMFCKSNEIAAKEQLPAVLCFYFHILAIEWEQSRQNKTAETKYSILIQILLKLCYQMSLDVPLWNVMILMKQHFSDRKLFHLSFLTIFIYIVVGPRAVQWGWSPAVLGAVQTDGKWWSLPQRTYMLKTRQTGKWDKWAEVEARRDRVTERIRSMLLLAKSGAVITTQSLPQFSLSYRKRSILNSTHLFSSLMLQHCSQWDEIQK